MKSNRHFLTFPLVILVLFTGAVTAQVAKARPAPVGTWQQLGFTIVDFKTDRDVIAVTGADNFRKLKFHVFDAPVQMINMHVIYENDAFDNIDLRFLIPAGGESRVLDLRGVTRRIRKVEFWYRSERPGSRGRAKVMLWGIK